MMRDEELQFLQQLLATPSPSGYEQPIQEVVRRYAASFADDIQTDRHGNVIVAINPAGSPRVMLAGHCDQIGLIVKHIDDRGFIWVQNIGGWDPQILLGQAVQIWTTQGPVAGVIARKPIHLLTADERKVVPEIKNLWIDVGASNGDEARELIAIGDVATVRLTFTPLRNDLVSGAGMDDKTGLWMILNAARLAKAKSPRAAIFAVSTVQEEIGLRGVQTSAFGIQPDVGIAVDVTHATDCPTIDENQYGRIKLGKGPVLVRGPNVNPRVFDRLAQLAQHAEIPYQVNALGTAASNDAAQLQLSGRGVATGLVCIPNRYMHSPVEVVSLKDLSWGAQLISALCATLTIQDDFTPRLPIRFR